MGRACRRQHSGVARHRRSLRRRGWPLDCARKDCPFRLHRLRRACLRGVLVFARARAGCGAQGCIPLAQVSEVHYRLHRTLGPRDLGILHPHAAHQSGESLPLGVSSRLCRSRSADQPARSDRAGMASSDRRAFSERSRSHSSRWGSSTGATATGSHDEPSLRFSASTCCRS